jgi:hypothetical protein
LNFAASGIHFVNTMNPGLNNNFTFSVFVLAS